MNDAGKNVTLQNFQIDNINSLDSYNIGDWLVHNILTEDVVNRLKENLLIAVPNTDSNSSAVEWIDMAIKSYFPKEDISIVAQNINARNESLNKYKQLYEDIQKEKNHLSEEVKSLEEVIESQKSKTFKLTKKIEQMIELSKCIEYNFEGVAGSDIIKALLLEAINSDSDELAEFIIPFSIHSQNIIMLKKYIKNDIDSDIQMFLDEVKILLKSISEHYIPQRKKLLEELANAISINFEDVKFVSPEEYTFVEPSIHNIPSSGGQKVVEGISFAVVKKDTDQTMIYADIKAQ